MLFLVTMHPYCISTQYLLHSLITRISTGTPHREYEFNENGGGYIIMVIATVALPYHISRILSLLMPYCDNFHETTAEAIMVSSYRHSLQS